MKAVWATSHEIDSEYLEIEINDGLGLLVVQDMASEDPSLIFCSLFSEPERTFHEGLDRKRLGVSIAQIRNILDYIKRRLSERPLT